MNLDELRSVQSKERQKDSLQHLRDSFYADVAEYVADRKAARDRAADEADDPFASPEVRRLTDEIETAEEVAEAIYERRMGKLVKQASLAAAGMSADEEGLTAEEKELFADLVDRIQQNKAHVLDVLSGDVAAAAGDDAGGEATTADPGARDAAESTPSPDRTEPSGHADGTDPASRADPSPDPTPPDEAPEAPPSDGVSAADVMGGDDSSPGATEPGEPASDGGSTDVHETSPAEGPPGGVPDSDGPSADAGPDGSTGGPTAGDRAASNADRDATAADTGATDDRVTLRITRDVGDILGVDDREYTLEREDVVTLPSQNADPLVERDAAEKLE